VIAAILKEVVKREVILHIFGVGGALGRAKVGIAWAE
jgi:hypothetical protein